MSASKQTRLVLATAVIYALGFSTLAICQHRGLKTQMNDLGNAAQAVWAARHGDLTMPQSNDISGKLQSRLGIHANFLFWPLALLYFVWESPEALLVVSSIACAVSGVGIYHFARHELGERWWALVPPFAFWLGPMTHEANLYDFHIITVTTALLVWAIWAFTVRRIVFAWVLLVLALCAKEDVAFLTALLGIYVGRTAGWRQGLAVSAVSLLFAGAVTTVVVPACSDGGGLSSVGSQRYGWLGASPGDVATTVLTEPGKILRHIARPDHLRLPVYLALSGGLAALGGWRLLVVAVPAVLGGLLAETAWMTRVTGTYYWITTGAIIVLACVVAASRRLKEHPDRLPWQLSYLGYATVLLSFWFSPLPHGLWASWANFAPRSETATLVELRKRIPRQAGLSVQNNLGAHLAHRPDVAAFPRRLESAEYVLLHLRYPGGPDTGLSVRSSPYHLFQMPIPRLVRRTRELLRSREWSLLEQEDGFYLFRRSERAGETIAPDWSAFEADRRILKEAYAEASRDRCFLAGILNGRYDWGRAD